MPLDRRAKKGENRMPTCEPAEIEVAERALLGAHRRPRPVQLLDMETVELILNFAGHRYAQLMETPGCHNALQNVRRLRSPADSF